MRAEGFRNFEQFKANKSAPRSPEKEAVAETPVSRSQETFKNFVDTHMGPQYVEHALAELTQDERSRLENSEKPMTTDETFVLMRRIRERLIDKKILLEN